MNIWSTVLQSLKKKVGSQAYNDWLKPTFEVYQEGNVLRVKVPNDRFKDHIRKHYLPLIEDTLEKTEWKNLTIDFVSEGPLQLSLPQLEDTMEQKPSLNSRYTFENFVVG